MILDASAVLALLRGEPGWDVVDAARPGSTIACVNWAEVVSFYDMRKTPPHAIDAMQAYLSIPVEPLDADLARTAGLMRATTAPAGLSLADRCCLALAKRKGLPALTADRNWLDVADAVGVEVRLIR